MSKIEISASERLWVIVWRVHAKWF